MALTIAVPGELIVIVPDAHPDVAWSLPAVSRWKFQVPNRSFCAKAPPRFRKIIRALPPVLSVQVAPIPVLSTNRTPCIQPMVPEVASELKSQVPCRSPIEKAAPERKGGIDRFSPPAITPGYPMGLFAGKAFPLVKSGLTIPRSMVWLFAALVIWNTFVDPM